MTLEVIVGVLSGSVFTEIARQVLHHFNRRIEFKKELQKFIAKENCKRLKMQ